MGTFAGTQLSPAQIYQYALAAGFPAGQPAEYATATAMTESDGWTGAISSTGATGLWQIIHGHWPKGMTQAQAEDPARNAAMAFQLWSARGGAKVDPSTAFADWWPYDGGPKNPNWAKYLGQAQSAANDPHLATPAVQAPTDTATPSQAIAAIGQLFGPPTNVGQAPIDTIYGGKLSEAASAAIGIAKGITDWLGGIVKDADNLLKAVLWLINPANEIRVLLAVFGLALFGVGGWLLIREVNTSG